MVQSIQGKTRRGMSADVIVGITALVVVVGGVGSVVVFSALKKSAAKTEQAQDKETVIAEKAKEAKQKEEAPQEVKKPTPAKVKAPVKKVPVAPKRLKPKPQPPTPKKPIKKLKRSSKATFDAAVAKQTKALLEKLSLKMGKGAHRMPKEFWERQYGVYEKYAIVQVKMWEDMMVEGRKMGLSDARVDLAIDRLDRIVEKGGFSKDGRVPMELIKRTLNSFK